MGDLGQVRELIAKDVNPDSTVNDGATPLINSVKNGHIEVVKFLISKNANPNMQDDCGFTPLMYAAKNNRQDIAELLIEGGALVGFKGYYRDTAISVAKQEGHDSLEKTLVKYQQKQKQSDLNKEISTYAQRLEREKCTSVSHILG